MPSYGWEGLAEGISPFAQELFRSRLSEGSEQRNRKRKQEESLNLLQTLKDRGIDMDRVSSVSPEGSLGFSSPPSLINLLGQNLIKSEQERRVGQTGVDQLTAQINQLAQLEAPNSEDRIAQLQERLGQSVATQQRGEAGVAGVEEQSNLAKALGLMGVQIPGLSDLLNEDAFSPNNLNQTFRGKDGRLYRIKPGSTGNNPEVELAE